MENFGKWDVIGMFASGILMFGSLVLMWGANRLNLSIEMQEQMDFYFFGIFSILMLAILVASIFIETINKRQYMVLLIASVGCMILT